METLKRQTTVMIGQMVLKKTKQQKTGGKKS